MEHSLRTDSVHFEDIANFTKTFELRKNDRDFKVGDILLLREINSVYVYTGRELKRKVIHVLPGGKYGLDSQSVIMSIIPLPGEVVSKMFNKCLEDKKLVSDCWKTEAKEAWDAVKVLQEAERLWDKKRNKLERKVKKQKKDITQLKEWNKNSSALNDELETSNAELGYELENIKTKMRPFLKMCAELFDCKETAAVSEGFEVGEVLEITGNRGEHNLIGKHNFEICEKVTFKCKTKEDDRYICVASKEQEKHTQDVLITDLKKA